MGHDKLRKFAENETFSCLLQPSVKPLLEDGYFNLKDHSVKGKWCADMFGGRVAPLVLELGCGKGEYTVGLAELEPAANYVGVDIKGARLWKGAKYATEHALPNVAFLRTRIEFINAFFAPSEVSEIWLTFSDPQYKSPNSRLTSPVFLEKYRSMLAPGGIVHLKTDSRFLYEYTIAVCRANGLKVLAATTDLYAAAELGASASELGASAAELGASAAELGASSAELGASGAPELNASAAELNASASELGASAADSDFVPEVARAVHTFYENMFLEQGYKITYLAFTVDHDGPFIAPEDFDSDYWRCVEGPRLLFGHDSSETRRQKLSKASSETL